jgi:hypothetical protein
MDGRPANAIVDDLADFLLDGVLLALYPLPAR